MSERLRKVEHRAGAWRHLLESKGQPVAGKHHKSVPHLITTLEIHTISRSPENGTTGFGRGSVHEVFLFLMNFHQ